MHFDIETSGLNTEGGLLVRVVFITGFYSILIARFSVDIH